MKNVNRKEEEIGIYTRFYARGIESGVRNMGDKLKINGLDEDQIHSLEHHTQFYIDSLIRLSDEYEESSRKYYRLKNNIKRIPIIGRWLWKKVKP